MITVTAVPLAAVAAASLLIARGTDAAADWYTLLRTVMMIAGGLVVIAIILIVAVAVISGVMGMIGKLRRKR